MPVWRGRRSWPSGWRSVSSGGSCCANDGVATDARRRVRAAAVNPGDWFFLRGTPYVIRMMAGPFKPRNEVLGRAVAGMTEAVGGDVRRFRPGDEVYAEVSHGGFAAYARVSEDAAALKPASLTFEQAAAVPLVGVTALVALRDIGQVRRGQRVLINGASGGVGTFAVQIAKAFGADVTGVCSTRNVDLVRSIGADQVIDYTPHAVTVRAPTAPPLCSVCEGCGSGCPDGTHRGREDHAGDRQNLPAQRDR